MQHRTPTADCDECGSENSVQPFGIKLEYVCNVCDAEMTSARFAAAKDE